MKTPIMTAKTRKGVVALAVFATMLVAGCASQWRQRPGSGPLEYGQDRYRCTQESRTGFSAGGTGYAGAGAIAGAAIAAQMNAQYLFDLCMEARGHTKIQPDSVAAAPAVSAPTVGTGQSITAVAPAPVQLPTQSREMQQAPGLPPGKIDTTTAYYIPYPGAEPVPVPPYGGPVAPEFKVSGPAPRAGSAPQVAPSLKGESTYMVVAEHLAKAQGCTPPAAAMTAKGAGQESFIVACPNGTTMSVQCSAEGCRVLR